MDPSKRVGISWKKENTFLHKLSRIHFYWVSELRWNHVYNSCSRPKLIEQSCLSSEIYWEIAPNYLRYSKWLKKHLEGLKPKHWDIICSWFDVILSCLEFNSEVQTKTMALEIFFASFFFNTRNFGKVPITCQLFFIIHEKNNHWKKYFQTQQLQFHKLRKW